MKPKSGCFGTVPAPNPKRPKIMQTKISTNNSGDFRPLRPCADSKPETTPKHQSTNA
jgi:hypothetical protein